MKIEEVRKEMKRVGEERIKNIGRKPAFLVVQVEEEGIKIQGTVYFCDDEARRLRDVLNEWYSTGEVGKYVIERLKAANCGVKIDKEK